MFNIKTSNFSQAGNSAADDAIKSFAAARRNSPDFGKMAQQAGAIRSKVKQEGINAAAQVSRAGIQTAANVKENEINVKAKAGLAKSKRKAGALAAAGKMFATAGQFGGEKRTKREISDTSPLDARIESLRSEATELRTKAEGSDVTVPQSSSNTQSSTSDGGTTENSSAPASSPTAFVPGDGSDGWNRLSKVIRFGEGTSGSAGYNTQFTGTQFQDMSQHPRQLRSGGGYTSDAAGAYQFLSTTWDGAKSALNLPDFSPESQEKAGRYLTQQRGVNPDQVFTNINDFKSAMDKLAPEWASLPYSGVSPSGHGRGSSYYGQGGKSLEQLWQVYNQT